MPLKLRRLQQQIELAIKVKSSQSHPANPVFLDHWTLHYGNYTDNNKPITVKVSTFFDSSDQTTVRSPKLTTKPPWTTKILEVDTSLTTYVNKKEASAALAPITRSKIYDEYNNHVHVYTDASKTTSGRVGIGCYIRSTPTTPETDSSLA